MFTDRLLMYKNEDDEFECINSSENIYVARDNNEIYWVRLKRADFDEMVEEVADEDDVLFEYEEGNDGYADQYDAELVSVTPSYVYFTVDEKEY